MKRLYFYRFWCEKARELPVDSDQRMVCGRQKSEDIKWKPGYNVNFSVFLRLMISD